MKANNWEQMYIAKELSKMIEQYDNWQNDEGEERNEAAKAALYRFYNEIIKYKGEDRFYERRDMEHTSYLFHLLEIRDGFEKKKYMRVCNGLVSLLYYEPFFQGRIYYNVLKLFESYLGKSGENPHLF